MLTVLSYPIPSYPISSYPILPYPQAIGKTKEDVTAGLLSVGFDDEMMAKPITGISGGWKMKLALTRWASEPGRCGRGAAACGLGAIVQHHSARAALRCAGMLHARPFAACLKPFAPFHHNDL